MSNLSIVADCGESASKCGYTKKENASHTYGIWAYHLTCQDYQDLIDRNWRRSGKYLYKPNPSKSECIQYTIRLDSHKFEATKKQKAVISKLSRYLEGKPLTQQQVKKKEPVKFIEEQNEIFEEVKRALFLSLEEFKITKDLFENKEKEIIQILPCRDETKGNFYSNIAFKLNNFLKKNKKEILEKDVILKVIMKNVKKIKCHIQDSFLYFFLDIKKKEVKEEKKEEEKKEILKTHNLKVELVKPKVTTESFNLYKKYQKQIHKDEESDLKEDSYKRFLVESPLYYEDRNKELKELKDEFSIEGISKVSLKEFTGFGTYHVHYRIDDLLIMVAVIDVLPYCVSSVYVYYDPDFDFLTLGVYSALSEIFYTQALSTIFPDLHYYYLGFYIHNIQKMKYKAQFQPSELLCPTTFKYYNMKDVLDIIDKDVNQKDFSKRILNFSKEVVEETSFDSHDEILCFYDGRLFRFKTLKSTLKSMNPSLYHKYVGDLLASKIALIVME
eukprot:gene12153-5643_t